MDLINVSRASQVSDAISSSLSTTVRDAIASTVLSLAELQRAFDNDSSLSTFLPDHLLLLPPRVRGVNPPGLNCLEYLRDLAMRANSAAESVQCSSILAGQGSESDDTGDVALWLGVGDYGPGNERKVLDSLELTSWLEQGAGVFSVPLSAYRLPSTLSASDPSPQAQTLIEKLGILTDRYCFRVSSPNTAPLVVFFFMGRFGGLGHSEWGGLVGIGTWSDQ